MSNECMACSWRENIELYLYIDESGVPYISENTAENDNFYVGMCLLENSISQSFIDDALTELKGQSDNTPSDVRCLDRGYFHASEDGPNAHSCLCTKIRSIPHLIFSYEKVNKHLLRNLDPSIAASESRLHQLMASLAAVVVSHAKVDCAHIRIAQRRGSFPTNVQVDWYENFIDGLVKSASVLPQIPFYLPGLDAIIVGANDPGVQVCDFLLWTAIRKFEEGSDPTWADRIELREYASSSSKSDPFSRKEYYINRPVEYPFASLDVNLVQNPFIPITNAHLQELFTYSERIIQYYSRIKLPQNAIHLQAYIDTVAVELKSSTISVDEIKHLAKAFIIIADTIPIYDINSVDMINRVIQAKYYLGIMYTGSNIRWLQIARWWLQTRQKLLLENPHVFDSELESDPTP